MMQSLPQISDTYKKEVRKSVFSIILFFTVYFILILVSLAILLAVISLAISFLKNFKIGFWTILIAGAMIGMGGIVFVFLIKFLFSVSKDNYEKIRITKEKEPALFQLIEETYQQVGAPAPKHVFLTTDVNAFVSYDSSFWSMFLPVKKNLTIGLGLINSTTVSELKSILAHEFGHFSQRSMKVGSYTNQAQKMLYDMLYNNEKFFKNISGFAGVHAVFYLFVMIAVYFIRGIQWILARLFDFLFSKHLSLSRQMEFNADAIAAHVVGSRVSAESLLRLSLSEMAFTKPLNFFYAHNKTYYTDNLYADQTVLMDFYAEEYSHKLVNQLPLVTLEESEKYNLSKLEIEDKWSSHPSIKDRVQAIEKENIPSVDINNNLARTLLNNFDNYAEALTNKLYSINGMDKKAEKINAEGFLELFRKEHQNYSFPKIFNGYYTNHNPIDINIDNIAENTTSVEELYSDKKVALVYEKIALEKDINTLKSIVDKSIKVKLFDYDGQKYERKEAKNFIPRLGDRLKEISDSIKGNDQAIYQHFYNKAIRENKQEGYLHSYKDLLIAEQEFEQYVKSLNEFLPFIHFMSQTLEVDVIKVHCSKLLEVQKTFKEEIRKLKEESVFSKHLEDKDLEALTKFNDNNQTYFEFNTYQSDHITQLNTAIDAYYNSIYDGYFKVKKILLDLQGAIEA
ncbi:M48 family metalloprotease [Elizabethkingia ursingii]|uniref:M48 family metalloprotease n=1 Tax=Elizabethkingia ursingii TaxID=1756150 RepID=UPI002011C95F|nr:M48 family metallopeptidase [Elizabethkingia ursingii]MCL1672221.1 M48 family metalloprotease [Elizabethkingia ursingii]